MTDISLKFSFQAPTHVKDKVSRQTNTATTGFQVLLVDMQYGTDKNPDVNPRLAELFLEEITASHRHSRGCFLLVSDTMTQTLYPLQHLVIIRILIHRMFFDFQLLVGTGYNTGWVPTKFTEETYKALLTHCSFLEEYYTQKESSYVLKASR